MKNEFRIESSKHGRARVWLNGVELHNIVSVETGISVGHANTVKIEFNADSINAAVEIDFTGLQSESRNFVKVDG